MDLDVLKHRLHERLIARGVSPTARAHVDHALDEAIKEIESREAHQQTVKAHEAHTQSPEEIATEWAKTPIGEPQRETGEVHSGILTNKPRRGRK